MYSWYMPKDQTIDEVSPGSHRHDFENVVIWLSGDMTTVLGGAASGHGDYKKTTGALPGGDSATVEYFASFPTNHELQFTETVGNTYPVSDWDAMPDAAKSALQNTDFGDASPPFKVSNCSLSLFPSFSFPEHDLGSLQESSIAPGVASRYRVCSQFVPCHTCTACRLGLQSASSSTLSTASGLWKRTHIQSLRACCVRDISLTITRTGTSRKIWERLL